MPPRYVPFNEIDFKAISEVMTDVGCTTDQERLVLGKIRIEEKLHYSDFVTMRDFLRDVKELEPAEKRALLKVNVAIRNMERKKRLMSGKVGV